MKIAILALLLALSSLAVAQSAAPQKPSARMSARVGASALRRANNYATNYGSYDLDIQREIRVDVELTTMNRAPVEGKIRWFLIGKPIINGGKRELIKSGEIPVTVTPKTTTRLTVDSGKVDATDMNLAAIGERYASGYRIEGWALRLVDSAGAEMSTASNTTEALGWIKTQPEWEKQAVKKNQ